MEAGERIAVAVLEEQIKKKCPFKESEEGVDNEEDESIEDDDDDDVQEEQNNNGGILGDNVVGGSQGSGGTWGGPYPAPNPQYKSDKQRMRVLVPETDEVEADEYPVTLAAHHLIPGNAALGQSSIYDFLGPSGSGKLKNNGSVRKRKDVTVAGQTFEIKKLIGYNINGCHNGVWLPGNYAIRRHQPKTKRRAAVPNTSPVGGPRGGANWGDLDEMFDDWKLNYVAASTKAADGQFHDTHENYSERVLKILDKMCLALKSHLKGGKCDCCSKEKVPPPFTVKARFYALSKFLRGQSTAGVERWKSPWLTSDGWGETIFSSKQSHKKFLNARRRAKRV